MIVHLSALTVAVPLHLGGQCPSSSESAEAQLVSKSLPESSHRERGLPGASLAARHVRTLSSQRSEDDHGRTVHAPGRHYLVRPNQAYPHESLRSSVFN